MSQYPMMTSGVAYPNSWSSPLNNPCATGMAVNVAEPSNRWHPSTDEIEIYVTPAGWAEAAYQNGENIDPNDDLSFLDHIAVQKFDVKWVRDDRMVQKDDMIFSRDVAYTPFVRVSLGHICFIGPGNAYNKVFPEGEERDILLFASARRMNKRKAFSVISHVQVHERELTGAVDTHSLYESMVLIGTNYYPFKEIE